MNEKSVKENLANMTFKEKFNYLLYYYKVHVIVFVLIAAFIGSFIYTEVSKKDIYLDISYIGSYISEETSANIQEDLTQSLLADDDSNMIQFNSYSLDNGGELTKVQASIAAHEIDVAVMNKENFNKYYPADLFLDLNSVPGFSSLNIDESSLIKEDDGIYGIKINNLNILNQLNTPEHDDNILVLVSTTENSDKLIQLLNSCGIN